MSEMETINKEIEILKSQYNKISKEIDKLELSKSKLIEKTLEEEKILSKIIWEATINVYNNISISIISLVSIDEWKAYSEDLEKLFGPIDYHECFEIAEKVRLINDDDDLYLEFNDIETAINFIKKHEIKIPKNIFTEIEKSEKEQKEYIEKLNKAKEMFKELENDRKN